MFDSSGIRTIPVAAGWGRAERLMSKIERFASTRVAPGSRLSYWNDICSDALSGTTVDSAVDGFRAEMWRWQLGALKLLRPRSDASVVRRTASHQDGLVLHLQLKGSARFNSAGRSTELAAGDFILSEAGAGYTFELSQGHELLVAEMPRPEMLRRLPDLEDRLCCTLSSLSPGGRVFRDFLLTLWRQGDETGLPCDPDPAYEAGVTDAFCDLCALAVQGATQPDRARDGAAITGLRRRCDAYIDAHLDDPDLGTAQLAREFGVSARTVQGIFSAVGTTPTDYIRQRRLRAAADCLRAEPARSVTEIAFGHGFNDSAYFTRLFRRQFGVAPTAWRDAES